jgi:hypothetical protein
MQAGAQQSLAVEMEFTGVHKAASRRGVPVLAIRGISEILGFRRSPGWTSYACHAAAAFARAFVGAWPRSDARPPAAEPPKAAAAAAVPPRANAAALRDTVFISFSEKDRDALGELKELVRPLEKQGILRTWDATKILQGQSIFNERQAALETAKVAVLLVSPSFLARDENTREVSALLSAGVPVFCLHVDRSLAEFVSYSYADPETGAERTIKVASLDALNDFRRPLKSLSNADRSEALMMAASKIVEAVTCEGQGGLNGPGGPQR